MEHISSVIIAIIVLFAGFTSFSESFKKILSPESADYTVVSLVIIAVAVIVKFLLGRYVKSEGKKYNSESLIASGTDAIFDSVVSLSTIVAAVISMLWNVSIEGWLGAVIAVIIIKAGVEILLSSLSGIIGERIDSELSKDLKKHISEYPDVLGAYDLSLHRYDPEKIIGSIHVELPDNMDAREIHSLTRSITEDIYVNYGIILTIGIYASNTANGMFSEMKEKLFDLIIDFKSEQKTEICNDITEKMKQSYSEYEQAAC